MTTTVASIRALPRNARRAIKPCRDPETMRRMNALWEAEGHLQHSQHEIAKAVGVSQQAVAMWEAEAVRQLVRKLREVFDDEDDVRDALVALDHSNTTYYRTPGIERGRHSRSAYSDQREDN